MATNFDLAPPTKTVDGLLAAPIDISAITAVLTFDGAAQTAAADATITYEVGPAAGNPIFDLRQSIAQAWLDGANFPAAQLAHHAFGAGTFTDLRVIEAVQSAGSVHTLRLLYDLALPDSQLGGSYLPALEWSAGPRLRCVFGLSDLNRARYAEAWLPANLPFDQFSIALEVHIINTLVAHEVITNGAIGVLGANHWSIAFPARFSTLSPMLELRAADTLISQTGTTILPVSGTTVTIEGWKPTGSAVNLSTQIANLQTLLADNELDYGPYAHGNRFVAFFNGSGGMEYEGGTTTSTGALTHETFHSWFARGIKPAAQADGWWDEAITTFHDNGGDDALPFDFGDPPIVLCSRDPWQRHTPANSYSDGARFWQGMASMLGVATLWIRTQDDGGTAHQSPEYGQDNWFHARVRNRAASSSAQHFVVTFHARGFAGTQFAYPADFLPCIAAKAQFDLAPGASRIVKARWPSALVPAAGSHTCLLASVITRGDHPVVGRHVWEHNNLAQKNLTVVDLVPAELMILPIVIGNRIPAFDAQFDLEVWRSKATTALDVSILHRSKDFFSQVKVKGVRRFRPEFGTELHPPQHIELECGAHLVLPSAGNKGKVITSATPDLVLRQYGTAWQLQLDAKCRTRVPVELAPFSQRSIGLLVQVRGGAAWGTSHRLHLVQRHRKTRQIAGGVALDVRIVKRP